MIHSMPYKTKQEWIFCSIKEMIENCELKPGERILLDQVASDFGVSRIPVREALLQLQSEGFVEMIPHAGAVVASVNFSDATDYFSISRELQVLAIRAFTERATDKEISELEGIVLKMEASSNDRELYHKLNQDFHDYIASHCRMPLIEGFLKTYKEHWNRFVRYYHLYPISNERIQQTLTEHRDILKAIKERNVDLAEQASRAHNLSGLEEHLSRMK